MIFKRVPNVQEYDFKCVDELKCDVINTALEITEDKKYNSVTAICSKMTALKLFCALINADVNGFGINLSEEDTIETCKNTIANNDVVDISLVNDGTLFVESTEFYVNDVCEVEDGCTNSIFLIEKGIDEKYINDFSDVRANILHFTVK